jgi:phage protein D
MEIGSSVTNVNAAKIIATAQYNLALEQFIEGSGRCGGKQKIKIGSNIRLSGLGKRFSGIYYVTACTHSYEQTKGYHINFAVSRMGI